MEFLLPQLVVIALVLCTSVESLALLAHSPGCDEQ